MSENAVNAERDAMTKEKKSLDPRIALAIMVIMVICALLNGANKAWKKNLAGLDASYALWQENVQQRVETAYNLLTVAGRHLPQEDALILAVRTDLTAMQSNADSDNQREVGCEKFVADAQALLQKLSSSETVKNDSRDEMYVSLMLPQALEQCGNTAALTAYNAAAQSFNDGMHSFSGLLARLTGIHYAGIIETNSADNSETATAE